MNVVHHGYDLVNVNELEDFMRRFEDFKRRVPGSNLNCTEASTGQRGYDVGNVNEFEDFMRRGPGSFNIAGRATQKIPIKRGFKIL